MKESKSDNVSMRIAITGDASIVCSICEHGERIPLRLCDGFDKSGLPCSNKQCLKYIGFLKIFMSALWATLM